MKEKWMRFMYGRYGTDGLNRFLLILALLLLIVSLFGIPYVSGVALLILIITYVRMFSKNTAARQKENVAYYKIRGKVLLPFYQLKNRFRDRKTHRYFKCPKCKKTLRVPKGKGTIKIKCPCGHSFQKRT